MSQRVWRPFYRQTTRSLAKDVLATNQPGRLGGTIATWLQFIATTRAFCLFTFSHISSWDSQPSQSLRFPMNVSPVPCRIGQQWRWNCELFELFESKEKFGLGAMSRGAHIPGFSPFYSNRLAARNLPSFKWIHWLNSLLAKYSSSIYFVLGLTSTLDGCPICNACDDLLRIRIAVMGIGILLWQETRCRLSQGRGGGMQVVLQKCYRGQVSVTVLQRPDQCDRGQASVTVLQGAGQCYSVTESRPGYRWRYVWWDLRPGACTCECDKGWILGNQ